MTGALFTAPRFRAVSANAPLAGARLAFYRAGTSVLASTYADSALSVEHPNPVIADAAAKAPPTAPLLAETPFVAPLFADAPSASGSPPLAAASPVSFLPRFAIAVVSEFGSSMSGPSGP